MAGKLDAKQKKLSRHSFYSSSVTNFFIGYRIETRMSNELWDFLAFLL